MDGSFDTPRSSNVFVYGSLKQTHGAHFYLRDQNFLGRFCVRGAYRMLDLGHFPGVVEITSRMQAQWPGTDLPIYGELYNVQPRVLMDLDRLEGHPTFYRRQLIEIYQGLRAWMYMLPAAYLTERKAPILTNGLWRPSPEEVQHWEKKNGQETA